MPVSHNKAGFHGFVFQAAHLQKAVLQHQQGHEFFKQLRRRLNRKKDNGGQQSTGSSSQIVVSQQVGDSAGESLQPRSLPQTRAKRGKRLSLNQNHVVAMDDGGAVLIAQSGRDLVRSKPFDGE